MELITTESHHSLIGRDDGPRSHRRHVDRSHPAENLHSANSLPHDGGDHYRSRGHRKQGRHRGDDDVDRHPSRSRCCLLSRQSSFEGDHPCGSSCPSCAS